MVSQRESPLLRRTLIKHKDEGIFPDDTSPTRKMEKARDKKKKQTTAHVVAERMMDHATQLMRMELEQRAHEFEEEHHRSIEEQRRRDEMLLAERRRRDEIEMRDRSERTQLLLQSLAEIREVLRSAVDVIKDIAARPRVVHRSVSGSPINVGNKQQCKQSTSTTSSSAMPNNVSFQNVATAKPARCVAQPKVPHSP